MSKKNRLLFVYGSLMREMYNNKYMYGDGTYIIGDYVTSPKFTMIDLGTYPGVLEGGTTSITGEIWQTSRATWKTIENLEGYPNYYTRIFIPSPLGEVSMYVLANPPRVKQIVGSGNWRGWVENKDRVQKLLSKIPGV